MSYPERGPPQVGGLPRPSPLMAPDADLEVRAPMKARSRGSGHDGRAPWLADAPADAVAAARRVVVLRAVPVLLDGDHLAEIEPGALQPQDHAADRASADAEALCRPDHRNQLPAVDLEHVPGGGDLDGDLAGARRHAGVAAGAPALHRRDTDFVRRRPEL